MYVSLKMFWRHFLLFHDNTSTIGTLLCSGKPSHLKVMLAGVPSMSDTSAAGFWTAVSMWQVRTEIRPENEGQIRRRESFFCLIHSCFSRSHCHRPGVLLGLWPCWRPCFLPLCMGFGEKRVASLCGADFFLSSCFRFTACFFFHFSFPKFFLLLFILSLWKHESNNSRWRVTPSSESLLTFLENEKLHTN